MTFLLAVAFACTASAAAPVRVSLVANLPTPVAGRAWTAKLTVRPLTYRGAVLITAKGMKRIDVRAAGGHGAYRARFVFPAAGRWTLAVRAGGSTSRLGSVQVRPPPVQPVAFTEPTSIDLEPGGTLLLVENNPGRVLRVDPKTGRVTVLVATTTRPYSIARAPSGGVFLSGENLLRRVDPNGSLTTVAQADSDIGPVAVAPDGDIFYTTETQIFRLAGGVGPPILVAAQLAGPHGLAVAGDGALLVSDTGNDRVRRIDRASGVITEFARIGSPRGIDVAADGTIYVIDSQQKRVVRLNAAGAPIGSLGPAFGDPYDVEVADSGVAYVLEAGSTGWVRRVAPDGTVTTISRR